MNERTYEQQHVKEIIKLINQEEKLLLEQQKRNSDAFRDQSLANGKARLRTGSDEAFYESYIEKRQHEQELLLRYQTLEAQEKRGKTLRLMEGSPYFARIDFKEEQEHAETLYIGIASLRDSKEETHIIDWRAPIANLYYEGELGETKYESYEGAIEVELLKKRQFKIMEGQILSMVDTTEAINDDFLLEILDEASSNRMKNIVATIQKSQNAIIRDTTSKVMLVEGIAGSGKTSALLQRVAFLLYRNRKWLDNEQVLLFSPNHLFSDYISTVLPSLGESGIPTETFRSFIQRILSQYEITAEEKQEEVFLSGKDDRVQRVKSGLGLLNFLKTYTGSIAAHGPLFRDLKINGQTVIAKEQIRNWYQEANPTLPIYQRVQLLQTKLLTKLGGLEKDEAKKQWAKDQAEELLQELFADDPNLSDSESQERKLRKQLVRKVVHRYFRGVTRRVKRFQFINYPKQYLHFLQSVPTLLLSENQLTTKEWHTSLSLLKEHFRSDSLTQEDSTLFFLLMKKLAPVNVDQKARFIFIDEMQDFSPAQAALLQELYPRATYTFCGDLNQKVFGNETIVNSIDQLFPDQEITRFQLTTSYRSTQEITDFANQFLQQDERIKLTARKGELPTMIHHTSQAEMASELIRQLSASKEQAKYWRTAIIGKTAAECQALYDLLPDKWQQEIQLITDEDDFMKRSIIIIPAFLAKGLEFDRVFAWNITETTFVTEQDKLILYTICTRAMHELWLLNIGTMSPLIAAVSKEHYQLLT